MAPSFWCSYVEPFSLIEQRDTLQIVISKISLKWHCCLSHVVLPQLDKCSSLTFSQLAFAAEQSHYCLHVLSVCLARTTKLLIILIMLVVKLCICALIKEHYAKNGLRPAYLTTVATAAFTEVFTINGKTVLCHEADRCTRVHRWFLRIHIIDKLCNEPSFNVAYHSLVCLLQWF